MNYRIRFFFQFLLDCSNFKETKEDLHDVKYSISDSVRVNLRHWRFASVARDFGA